VLGPNVYGLVYGMSTSTLRPWLLVFGLCALPARPALAQELDDQTRSAARELATEGSSLYQQSDFDGAYDRFNRAYQLVQRPNVGIWAARSLVRAGRWVEASERYLELERSTLPADAPAEQTQAQEDAARERRELLARIPSIKVVVEGAEAGSVFVSLNGQLVKAALIGAKQPVNPGKLLVKGVRGEQVVEASVELAEAQFREVKLVFTPAPASAPPASDAPPSSPPVLDSRTASSSNQRLLGFIGLGIGGALLGTGAVFGALAAGDERELSDRCPERQCAPAYHGDNDAYGTKKTISSIGIIGGAALAAAGAVLVFTAPSESKETGLRLRGYVSLDGGGLMGAF
jgi:hypothetical protein